VAVIWAAVLVDLIWVLAVWAVEVALGAEAAWAAVCLAAWAAAEEWAAVEAWAWVAAAVQAVVEVWAVVVACPAGATWAVDAAASVALLVLQRGLTCLDVFAKSASNQAMLVQAVVVVLEAAMVLVVLVVVVLVVDLEDVVVWAVEVVVAVVATRAAARVLVAKVVVRARANRGEMTGIRGEMVTIRGVTMHGVLRVVAVKVTMHGAVHGAVHVAVVKVHHPGARQNLQGSSLLRPRQVLELQVLVLVLVGHRHRLLQLCSLCLR